MTAPEQFPPFVFVLGAGRSGTSVLRTVLDGHSRLAVCHEGRFVFPMSRRRSRYERTEGFDVDAFTADLLADPGVRGNLGLDPDDLRVALGGAPVADYPDAVRRVFAHYASQRGKVRYGDKMPAYVLRIPALAEMFPEGRFVHIIRDGRDVALSAMAIAGQRHDPVALAIDWRRRVEAGRAAGARLGAHRYHEVRYEQLVADPAEPIAALCNFLDLDYEPGMLQFFERRDSVPAKVRANPRHARLAEPLSSGPRSWRTAMAPADLERFEAVAGDLLSQLGYERGAARPSITARAAAAWGRVRWSVHGGGVRLPGVVRRAMGRPRRPSPRP
ncbi:MAG TPA: sulfotransferase [Ilumatobacteraceae bacterium]|nr:sulfotransferase [Ilumatobacteraceae bacterium]